MVRKKGKGRAVKSARRKFGTHHESDELKLASHTMVIKRGNVEKEIKELITDMRNVMEPFTASELKVTKKNSLKDFVAIAGPMHVTHLIMFSQTEIGDYMKLMRLPRGPTLHFKVEDFSLVNDVLSVMKKKYNHKKQYLHQPLLILNGFNTKVAATAGDSNIPHIEPHLKLLTTTLQNMFPSINVTKVKLDSIRRCVLFNYNKEDKTIDFRQYNIRLMPVGLSKPVKKLVQERLPDLSNFQDISEFIEKGGNLSESEAEFDGTENQIQLPQDVKQHGAVNLKNTTSAIRLAEIGPRLKLKLIKIEEGICDGEVLYHEFIAKTPEEVQEIREKLSQKKKAEKVKEKEKMARQKLKDAKFEKNKKNKKDKTVKDEYQKDIDYESGDEYDEARENREYYKQELGHEPAEDFVTRTKKRKRDPENEDVLSKKQNRLNIDHYKQEFGENGVENKPKKRKFEKKDENGTKSEEFKVKFEKKSKPKSAKFVRFAKKK